MSPNAKFNERFCLGWTEENRKKQEKASYITCTRILRKCYTYRTIKKYIKEKKKNGYKQFELNFVWVPVLGSCILT